MTCCCYTLNICNLLLIINASVFYLLGALTYYCSGVNWNVIYTCVTLIQYEIIRYFFKFNNCLDTKKNCPPELFKITAHDLGFTGTISTPLHNIHLCHNGACLVFRNNYSPSILSCKLSIFALYSTLRHSNHNCSINNCSIGM